MRLQGREGRGEPRTQEEVCAPGQVEEKKKGGGGEPGELRATARGRRGWAVASQHLEVLAARVQPAEPVMWHCSHCLVWFAGYFFYVWISAGFLS